MTNALKWYEKVTGGDSKYSVAAAAGISRATLVRQLNSDQLSPENVIAIARAYDADIVDGLEAIGLCTSEELRPHFLRESLASLSDDDIVAVVAQRLKGSSAPHSLGQSQSRRTD